MAKSLEENYGEEVQETVKFVKMIDKFFDCSTYPMLLLDTTAGNHSKIPTLLKRIIVCKYFIGIIIMYALGCDIVCRQ